MGFAGAELWLGVGVVAVWLVVAVGRLVGHGPAGGRYPRATTAATGVAAVAFVLQAAVVLAVADGSGISGEDRPTLAWMIAHRSSGATELFRGVADVGGSGAMTGLALVVAAVLWFRRHRHEAVVLAVAVVGADVLVEVLKQVYRRPRPPIETRLAVETAYSLPSGHALASIVVLGMLAALAVMVPRRRAVGVTAVLAAVVVTGLIGLSRLYLGVHWFTDVLDGWLVGVVWLALCLAALVRARARAASGTPEPVASVRHAEAVTRVIPRATPGS